MKKIKWKQYQDLGLQNILGKDYYVTLGPSGKLYLTDMWHAKMNGNQATYRYWQDRGKMSEEEWREITRQACIEC